MFFEKYVFFLLFGPMSFWKKRTIVKFSRTIGGVRKFPKPHYCEIRTLRNRTKWGPPVVCTEFRTKCWHNRSLGTKLGPIWDQFSVSWVRNKWIHLLDHFVWLIFASLVDFIPSILSEYNFARLTQPLKVTTLKFDLVQTVWIKLTTLSIFKPRR